MDFLSVRPFVPLSNPLIQFKSLSLLNTGTRIPIHIASPTLFLPQEPEIPIILVGPGTGVAPMRAFVEVRVRQGAAKSECPPLFPTSMMGEPF